MNINKIKKIVSILSVVFLFGNPALNSIASASEIVEDSMHTNVQETYEKTDDMNTIPETESVVAFEDEVTSKVAPAQVEDVVNSEENSVENEVSIVEEIQSAVTEESSKNEKATVVETTIYITLVGLDGFEVPISISEVGIPGAQLDLIKIPNIGENGGTIFLESISVSGDASYEIAFKEGQMILVITHGASDSNIYLELEERNIGGEVAVKYVDQEGALIKEAPVTLAGGEIGDVIDIPVPTLPGYQFISSSQDPTAITITDVAQEITFVYGKEVTTTLDVTVNDKTGKEVDAYTITVAGLAGESIKEALKPGPTGGQLVLQNFVGDETHELFVSKEGAFTFEGIVGTSDQQFTAIFVEEFHGGAVTVKYVDQDGQPMPNMPVTTAGGEIGEEIEIIAPSVTGYSTPLSQKITITSEAQEITFVYKKEQTVLEEVTLNFNVILEDGTSVGKLTVTDLPGSAFSIALPDAPTGYYYELVDFVEDQYVSIKALLGRQQNSGSGNLVLSGTMPPTDRNYVVKVKKTAKAQTGGEITVVYVDENGQPMSNMPATTTSGQLGETIKLTAAPVKGYLTPLEQSVVITADPQTVTFVYVKMVTSCLGCSECSEKPSGPGSLINTGNSGGSGNLINLGNTGKSGNKLPGTGTTNTNSTNKTQKRLPQTGEQSSILNIIGTFMLACVALFLMRFRKENS